MTRARLLVVLLVPALGCDALVGVHDLLILENDDASVGPADAAVPIPGLADTGPLPDVQRVGVSEDEPPDSTGGGIDATTPSPEASDAVAGDAADGEANAADASDAEGASDDGFDGSDAATSEAGFPSDVAAPGDDASEGGDDAG
jgi:hypothetical protein